MQAWTEAWPPTHFRVASTLSHRTNAEGLGIEQPPGPTGTLTASMTQLKPEQIIALVAPIVVIQLGLMIAALYDLEKSERRVRGDSKLVWAVVIVFVNVIGPILYFVVGREES
jgi:hypothetical protein